MFRLVNSLPPPVLGSKESCETSRESRAHGDVFCIAYIAYVPAREDAHVILSKCTRSTQIRGLSNFGSRGDAMPFVGFD